MQSAVQQDIPISGERSLAPAIWGSATSESVASVEPVAANTRIDAFRCPSLDYVASCSQYQIKKASTKDESAIINHANLVCFRRSTENAGRFFVIAYYPPEKVANVMMSPGLTTQVFKDGQLEFTSVPSINMMAGHQTSQGYSGHQYFAAGDTKQEANINSASVFFSSSYRDADRDRVNYTFQMNRSNATFEEVLIDLTHSEKVNDYGACVQVKPFDFDR